MRNSIIGYGKKIVQEILRDLHRTVFGLIMLGFLKETVEFFNQFYTTQEHNLGDQLLKSYQMADKVGFLMTTYKKTNKRMDCLISIN